MSAVVRCCPLLSAVVRCCPLLSAVVRCILLVSVGVVALQKHVIGLSGRSADETERQSCRAGHDLSVSPFRFRICIDVPDDVVSGRGRRRLVEVVSSK